MNKKNLILYSAIIMAVFDLLFYMETPQPQPEGKVKAFLKKYEGKQGFAVLKVPEFLLGELILNDSLHMNKKSFQSFRMMILHEQQNAFINCSDLERELTNFLDSLKFQILLERNQNNNERRMKIYNRDVMDSWRENVTIYASDSTFFLFNFISDIKDRQVIRFSDHLSHQEIF